MKRLLLIRHGKAAVANGADFDRPLAATGEQEVATVAARLAASSWVPQAIIASTAPRALATASLLAGRLGQLPLVAAEELYLAGEDTLRRAIAQYGGDYHSVALVAHNPGLTLLIRSMARVGLDDLPTAGVAGIALADQSWQQLQRGRLQYFDAPLWRQATRVPRFGGDDG